MIGTIFGFKKSTSQRFTRDGHRVPVTVVESSPMTIFQVKQPATDGYWAVKVGIGERKLNHTNQPTKGQIRGANKAPRFFREIRLDKADEAEGMKLSEGIQVASVLAAGDVVDVSGVSKGKGFAGAVKRYHFKGGPRSHGQSDRERAPGSSGSTTTPGRVYKGKRRAGHMGSDKVTVKNLTVLGVSGGGDVLIKGVVPGATGLLVAIRKTGKQAKRFEGLLDQSGTLDREAIAREQEEMAKAAGAGEEKGSKTAEAIKKAMESQKTTSDEAK